MSKKSSSEIQVCNQTGTPKAIIRVLKPIALGKGRSKVGETIEVRQSIAPFLAELGMAEIIRADDPKKWHADEPVIQPPVKRTKALGPVASATRRMLIAEARDRGVPMSMVATVFGLTEQTVSILARQHRQESAEGKSKRRQPPKRAKQWKRVLDQLQDGSQDSPRRKAVEVASA